MADCLLVPPNTFKETCVFVSSRCSLLGFVSPLDPKEKASIDEGSLVECTIFPRTDRRRRCRKVAVHPKEKVDVFVSTPAP